VHSNENSNGNALAWSVIVKTANKAAEKTTMSEIAFQAKRADNRKVAAAILLYI
jgi:hypothetical protein